MEVVVLRFGRYSLLAAAVVGTGCGARTELDRVDGDPLGPPSTTSITTGATTTTATTTTTSTTATTSTSTSTTTITTGPTGPTALCPPPIYTTPLTEIQVVGDGVDDGMIVQWQWELVLQPVGSSPEEPMPADTPVTWFTPDVAGEYALRLTVIDDDGFQDSCDVDVLAFPDENFRVELYWNPPEDPSDVSDVDLHVLHPGAPAWFDDQLDCYYANCSAAAGMVLDWDIHGYLYDNPRLDLDDVDGYGPENINIIAPVVGQQYTVGVHYYDAESSGPAQAYIKIYCGESNTDPVYLAGPTELQGSQSWELNEFWKVATVVWDGAGCEITPIDSVVSTQEALSQP